LGWEETVKRHGLLINVDLKGVLERLDVEAEHYHPFIRDVYSRLAEYVLRGGKRLASVCTVVTYLSYRGELNEDILRVCSGVELYRHSILLHDDIVDDESLRRGGNAFQNLFKEYNGDENDSSGDGASKQLGGGCAVFAGDIAYTLAVRCFLLSGFKDTQLVLAVKMLNDGFTQVNESQMLDLLFEHKSPDEAEWYVMASKRAASLFKTAVLVGAVLGDAPASDLSVLSEAAENIGYAFDIQDDIIDTFASKEQYGREPGGDLIRGKKPLHIIYTLKMGDQKTIETLHRIQVEKKVSAEDLQAVQQGMQECGALDAAKTQMKNHAEKAHNLIEQTSLNHEAKEFYNSLLKFITENLDWYK
jgi:geranylgeranyl pyrophosphate synthase